MLVHFIFQTEPAGSFFLFFAALCKFSIWDVTALVIRVNFFQYTLRVLYFLQILCPCFRFPISRDALLLSSHSLASSMEAACCPDIPTSVYANEGRHFPDVSILKHLFIHLFVKCSVSLSISALWYFTIWRSHPDTLSLYLQTQENGLERTVSSFSAILYEIFWWLLLLQVLFNNQKLPPSDVIFPECLFICYYYFLFT
jgi:hypothetical protein